MGIVYSGSNCARWRVDEIKDGGLTNLGYDAVMRMNKVGMLIDVSHAGDVTAMETIQASKDPVCILHRGSAISTLSCRNAWHQTRCYRHVQRRAELLGWWSLDMA